MWKNIILTWEGIKKHFLRWFKQKYETILSKIGLVSAYYENI